MKIIKKVKKEQTLSNYVKLDHLELLKKIDSTQFGLTDDKVEENRLKYGSNKLKEKRLNVFLTFTKSFLSPFNIILIIIDAFSFYSYLSEDGDRFDLIGALLVLFMILLSGTIYFVQEIRSHLVIKKMLIESRQQSKIIRGVNFNFKSIDNANSIKLIKEAELVENDEIVYGDLVYFSNGDLVPADTRIVWSNNLYLNQSSLTGESFPVQKKDKHSLEKNDYLEYENICYTGTEVVSGSGLGIVVATGENTYFSLIDKKVKEKRPKSSFEKGIKKVILFLIAFMLAVTPIVFAVYALRPGEIDNKWFNATLFAVAVAVGLTPEMLPIIVTSNLSRGYSKIKKNNVIVKNLNAVQNIGAIDILCTDKTGTITSGEISLDKTLTFTNQKSEENIEKILYLNSYFQSGFQNPIDQAVLLSKKIKKPSLDGYQKEWEVPFDFKRKILSVILTKDEQKEIFTKGAVEEILKVCNRISINGEIKEITKEHKEKIISKSHELNSDGFRVIGIAHNVLEDEDIEDDLVFYGYATFYDEPKKTSKEIIKKLEIKGITTKVLTGDSEVITRSICKNVDFSITKLYTGKQIEEMSEENLHKAVKEANVFVKLSPLHKTTIIETLKKQGHVVGFMGDGINDAPVLRESDIAISFSDASNIAQEAADMIIMGESLMAIDSAVTEGRYSLANILKYIKVTIASNFGNVLSVLVALFLTTVEPMQPLHLLLQNLLYDIVMFAFIFDKVDKKFLEKPRPFTTKNMIWFALINGPVSSIFDISTFIVLLYAFQSKVGVIPGISNSDNLLFENSKEMFNASWFLVGLMTQTAVMQMYRTEKIPFIQSRAAWQVNVSTLFVCSMAIIIPYTPINATVKMATPPLEFMPIGIGFVLLYICMAQTVKIGYIKLFKEWL
ncbi:Mg(2+) transport ATPase, P-type [Spiroplasma corruscae]|uniref:Magnesium-transporting ATPase, P-type 1 n=1 Tax=Spiroplasma corruscae TaxID=216934 RepID=A0A222EQ58_9MOLU|nr:magnesium-translocating P-type ATPase [Spiroplasma corruscae]ASP28670.1 Mg(2+) transport ATPase, P-type [Spiroplasma corruscae]